MTVAGAKAVAGVRGQLTPQMLQQLKQQAQAKHAQQALTLQQQQAAKVSSSSRKWNYCIQRKHSCETNLSPDNCLLAI